MYTACCYYFYKIFVIICFLCVCVCTGSFADFFPFTFDFWLASYHNHANFLNVVVILPSFFCYYFNCHVL